MLEMVCSSIQICGGKVTATDSAGRAGKVKRYVASHVVVGREPTWRYFASMGV
jgi:hypothetical protein